MPRAERTLPEADPDVATFDLVAHVLTRIAHRGPDATLLRAFELQLLQHAGLLLDLTHVDGAGGVCVAYDARAGMLRADETAGSVPFSEEARAAAVALSQCRIDDDSALPDIDDATLRIVSRIFALHLRAQGGPPLRSIAFLQALQRRS